MRKFYAIFFFIFSALSIQGQNLNEAWALTAGGSGDDIGYAIVTDHQGHIYIGGSFSSTSFSLGGLTVNKAGTTDAFLAKLDNAGNVLWLKSFANATVSLMTMDAAGFIYVVGISPGLAKLDNSGTIIWKASTAAVGGNTIQIDSRGNIYIGGYSGFSKYRSDGSFVYSKTVPYYMAGGGFSLDRQDNAHVVFFANSASLSNGSQNFNVNLTTKAIYDSSGQIASVQQLTSNPRWYPKGYKAIWPNDYYISANYPTLISTWYLGIGHNAAGSFGFGNCLYKEPINPEIDGLGSEFYAGWINDFATCGGMIPSPVFAASPTPVNALNGVDIFYVKNSNSASVGGTTALNGKTNEHPYQIAVDSVTRSFYILGEWAKITDTAKFRFGNSVLTNYGNGSTKDVLLLKFSYNTSSLSVNAGKDKTVCWGGSVQLTPDVSGGAGSYTYQWSPSTGLSNPSILNPTAYPTATANYILTVTDQVGTTGTDTINVIVDSNLYKPTIAIVAGTNPFCEGNTLNLMANSATSYQWSTGGTAPNISLTQSATLTLTAKRADGCMGTSLPFVAVMKPRTATPTISPFGNASFCAGGFVTLTAQDTESPVSYYWNTGATTPSITVNTSGTYIVSATGAGGCSSLTSSKTVTVTSLPTGTVTASGSTAICEGDSIQLILTTANGNNYVWNTGATSSTIWVKDAGTYSVQITSSQGCSATSNSIATVIKQRPVPKISQRDNSLNVQSVYATYQWYFNGEVLQGATMPTLTINRGGAYNVKVTTNDGCSSSASYTAVLRIVNPDVTYQVYPNPPVDVLAIDYTLKQQQKVSISIKNLLGQTVYQLVNNQTQAAGTYQLVINDLKRKMKESCYIIEFRIGDKIISHKLIISN